MAPEMQSLRKTEPPYCFRREESKNESMPLSVIQEKQLGGQNRGAMSLLLLQLVWLVEP